MSSRTYFYTVGIIFLLIAAVHGLRLVFGWEAVIGGANVPMLPSVIAVIVAGYLAYQGFKMEKRRA